MADTATTAWNGGTTVWGTAGNWGGGLPSATNSALFNGTFSNQPQLGATGTSQGIWLATGAAQDVTITGLTSARTLNITGTATLGNQANAGILLDDTANHNLTLGNLTTTTLTNSTGFYVNNAGTLTVAGGTGTLALGGNTLTLGGTNASGTTVLAGVVGGTLGKLVVNTAGSVTLSGAANTFTGGVTLTSGTLNINKVAALGTTAGTFAINGGRIDNTSGAAITTSSYVQTWGGDFTFVGSNNLNLGTGTVNLGAATRKVTTSAGTLTVGGIISNGTLSKDGAGTLLLTGTNTFNGLNVQQGTLQLATSATAAGAGLVTIGSVGNSATLDLNGASRTINSLATAGTAANQTISNSAGTAATLNYTGATTSTFGGVIQNGPGASTTAVTINNAAANVTLSGNNTFSGGVNLTAGRLNINHASALGSGTFAITTGATIDNTSGAAVTVSNTPTIGTGFTYGGTNDLTFGSGTINSPLGGVITLNGTGRTLTFGGTLNNTATTNIGQTINGAGNTLALGGFALSSGTAATATSLSGSANITFTGPVTNGSAFANILTYSGTGTVTFQGTNTFTGEYRPGGGTTIFDFSAATAPTSNINSASSGLSLGTSGTAGTTTISMAGKANTANSQAFSVVTLTGTASHLNLSTSGSGTMAVALGTTSMARSSGTGSTLDITTGAGTSLTTNQANGANGILVGMITLNKTDFAANSGGNIVPFTAYTNSTATTLGTAGNQVVDVVGNVTTAPINQGIGLRFNQAAANTVTNSTTNTFIVIGGGQAGASILVTPNVGANLSTISGGLIGGISSRDLIVMQNNTLGDLQIDSLVTSINANGHGFTKSGAGKLILGGKNTYNSTTYIHEGTVAVTADATVGNVQNLTTTASTTLTGVNTTGLFIGQRVLGAGLVSSGAYITAIDTGLGTVTLNAATTAGTQDMTFSSSGGLGTNIGVGGVLIASGATLQIGNNGTGGSLASGQSIASSGTVAFNRSNALSFSNTLLGSGGVSQIGSGTTTLPGTMFYSGDTLVSNGTLVVAGDTVAAQSGVAGNRTSGSPTITVSSGVAANLRVGQSISGSGVAPGASIANISGTTVTMNSGATSTNASNNLVFGAGSGLGTGAVSVTGGTLLVDTTGNINGTTMVSVTGGTFKYNGTAALDRNVTVNGGKFSYNSSNNYTGTLNFVSGTIGGSNISNLNLAIGTGQIMAPGNSTGTMTAGITTWITGGTFQFEINDATGTAGSTSAGWDLLNATSLDITAGVGEFTIQIVSLDNLQVAGNALNFNSANDYTWLFVDAGSAISGFDASKFVFSDAFTNTTTGTFSIAQGTGPDTDKLYINYTAVIPEPSTYAMLIGGLGLLAYLRRRSKKS